MTLKTMVIIFLAWAAILSPGFCFADEQQKTNSHAEELFSMVDRLVKVKQWKLGMKLMPIVEISKITGHSPKRTSLTGFASDEQPENKIIRQVLADYNPREDRITGVWLCLPKQGLGITRADIFKNFGKWDEKGHLEKYDEDSWKRFGYRTLIQHNYKRPSGAWLGFDFDNDAAKQLRNIRISP